MSYIPSKEADLGAWMINFSTLISANPPSWGLMPSDASGIASYVNAFTTALALVTTTGSRTKALVADKNSKRAAMLSIVRQYAQQIKADKAISNDSKTLLGLTIDSTSRARLPAPSTRPIITPVAAAALQQSLRFADITTPDKRGKPPNVQGLMVFVTVGTAPPAAPGGTFCGMATSQPYAVNFQLADVGKTAYYYGQWISAAGLLGPWSAIAAMTVAA